MIDGPRDRNRAARSFARDLARVLQILGWVVGTGIGASMVLHGGGLTAMATGLVVMMLSGALIHVVGAVAIAVLDMADSHEDLLRRLGDRRDRDV